MKKVKLFLIPGTFYDLEVSDDATIADVIEAANIIRLSGKESITLDTKLDDNDRVVILAGKTYGD